MNVFGLIERVNRRMDSYLAPPSESRTEKYTNILTTVEFDTALHLGSGRDKRNLHELLEDKGDLVALDPDNKGLRQNPSSDRVLADGQRLPFTDDSFDLVFSEYVFEHLPRPTEALEEIGRVLKSGGSFVVLVPNPKHYYAKIADLTPFWFHQFCFRLQGVENPDEDRFPTQYEWGSYHQITDIEGFDLVQFESFPGPTGYTRILPFHFLFVIIDRLMSRYPSYHVAFLAHHERRKP